MSSTYTGNPANDPASITIPGDGDAANAASVNTPFEALADKVEYAIAGNHPAASFIRLLRHAETFDITQWAATTEWQWLVNTGVNLWFPIEIPDLSLFTSAYAIIAPASGHGGVPATPPKLTIFSRDMLTTSTTIINTFNDSAIGSVAIYEAIHSVGGSITGTVAIQNGTKRYLARVTSESGANATAGGRVLGVQVQFATSAIDQGAS